MITGLDWKPHTCGWNFGLSCTRASKAKQGDYQHWSACRWVIYPWRPTTTTRSGITEEMILVDWVIGSWKKPAILEASRRRSWSWTGMKRFLQFWVMDRTYCRILETRNYRYLGATSQRRTLSTFYGDREGRWWTSNSRSCLRPVSHVLRPPDLTDGPRINIFGPKRASDPVHITQRSYHAAPTYTHWMGNDKKRPHHKLNFIFLKKKFNRESNWWMAMLPLKRIFF